MTTAKPSDRKAAGEKPAEKKPAVRKTAQPSARKPPRPAPTGAAEVDAFMKALKHPFKEEVEALRAIIRGASRKLQERVKWKAPSFYCRADMCAFNLHQTRFVQLIFVFPRGIPAEDGGGLLQGTWKDRREARFSSMEDVLKKKRGLVRVVRAWVASMDGG